MANETISTAPALHASALEPVPMDGCLICAAAATGREAARRLTSTVSLWAANKTIALHPHRRATDMKGAAA